MERLPGQEESGLQFKGPIGCNEIEITIFIWTVDFVANNGMAGVSKMDADLVGTAGPGFGGK